MVLQCFNVSFEDLGVEGVRGLGSYTVLGFYDSLGVRGLKPR